MTPPPMGHEDAWESLSAAVLGALDPAEEAALLTHVASCAECQAEMGSLYDASAAFALAAPPVTVSPERKEAIGRRVLQRIRADREKMLIDAPVTGPVRWRAAEWWAMAASVLFLAAAGGVATLMHQRNTLRAALLTSARRTVAAELGIDSVRAVLAERDQLLLGLTGKDMDLVTLTSDARREAWALMFWNRQTNGWTFVAHNLPAPRPGRTYQLWLVTADAKKISAGTFTPLANGTAMVRATYALPRSALKAVAVTDEPAGGVPQPTGAFVVIGSEGGAAPK